MCSSAPDDYHHSLYPEPPQGALFASPSPHLDMHPQMSPSSFFPRHCPDYSAATPPTPMTAVNGNLVYADTAAASAFTSMFHHDRLSPNYSEDPDMQLLSSSLSTASGASAPSSAIGSPRSNPAQEWATHVVGVSPDIVGHGDVFASNDFGYTHSNMDEYTHYDFPQAKFVADPSVLHPEVRNMGIPSYDAYPHAPPPTAVTSTFLVTPEQSPDIKAGSASPYPISAYTHTPQYSGHYTAAPPASEPERHLSHDSVSGFSVAEQQFSDGESKEKQLCPHPDCGKRYKDLRAHMLTHLTERPEKCPIQTCEYHTKGFARKYDKNRHTLTHYKGTMVCGFCPGSGSPAEKSFNRADVFKRHLTAVHGVEQTPPNSRKKSSGAGSVNGGAQKLATYASDATGRCSTCSQTFMNAQEFYEHLDDCVLRIVQLEDPAEAVNASHLAEVEEDEEVRATLEKHQLPTTTMTPTASALDEEDDDDMEEGENGGDDGKDGSIKGAVLGSPSKRLKGNPPNGVQKSRGMTHSRGGVPFQGKSRSRRSRQNYPTSWGFDKGQMTMRKRVLTVFDGARRLAKDDMMLSMEHEVRLKLSDGKSYITDLDVQTLKRAEGFLNATDEEKGDWLSDDPTPEQIQEMHALSAAAAASM